MAAATCDDVSQRRSRGLVTGGDRLPGSCDDNIPAKLAAPLHGYRTFFTTTVRLHQQTSHITYERRDLHGVNLCNIFVTRFLTPAKRQQKLAFKTIKRLRKNADVVQMRSKRIRTRSTVNFKCVTEAILIRLLQAHRSYFVNNLNEKSHVLTKSPFSGQIRDLLG